MAHRAADDEPPPEASLEGLLSDGDIDTVQKRRGGYRVTVLAVILLSAAIAGISWLSSGPLGTSSGLSVANYEAQAKVDEGPAPEFSLPPLDGQAPISLGSYAPKVVVLNFWASWCLPCRQEAPALQAAWVAYRQRGVQFLGVDERDDRAAGRAFQDEFRVTYPTAFDPAGELADDYGLLGLPSTFLIDSSGQIVYRFTGYLDGRVLRSALDRMLKERSA